MLIESLFGQATYDSWLLGALTVGLLLLFLWLLAAIYYRQQGLAISSKLGESGRGQLSFTRSPQPRGFFVQLQPPPEPFWRLSVAYHTTPNPIEWVLRRWANQQARLVIQGQLAERPQAELLWIRGRVPARALSRARNPDLWVQRRMDFMPYEYATRGVNTSAIVHAFTDLQTRFGPQLAKVAVQADAHPEIEIVVRTAGLDLDEIPALITTIRALGRAARKQ
ncbi:MAG: hypothetical protein KF832_14565 [Caldilineaceae bacterium]|nr:hypothetical protein [Caldilineaceae bacterium]